MAYFTKAFLLALSLIAVNANAQLLDTIVDAGPYKLHFRILKGANPPILFESGGGQDASQWDSIAPEVHRRLQATIITYDRAGFGQSSFDTTGYTLLQEIKSLEEALGQLGYLYHPIILVGHSLGGFYNRVYADRHTRQVKGIILVDPRIPSKADRQFVRRYFQSLNRSDYEADYMSLYYLLARMESTSDYVRKVPLPSSIPILDLMAERGPFSDETDNERFKAEQRALVKGYQNRSLVYVKDSSHNIPYDQPALMIEQVVAFYTKHLK